MNTESKFAIYTSFYKSERYIDQIYENLMSIKYSNWTWFVTDDFSPDNTKSKLLKKIQDVFTEELGKPVVDRILFTTFIVQQ